MPRLYDRLLVGGYEVDPEMAGVYQPFMRSLEDATVVVADNVTSYYYNHTPGSDGDGLEDIFPWLVPPITPLFVETRPARGVGGPQDVAGWGSLFVCHDLHESDDVLDWSVFRASPRAVTRGMSTEARWVVQFFLFIHPIGKNPSIWMAGSLPLSGDGRFCRSEHNRLSLSLLMGLPPSAQRQHMETTWDAARAGTMWQMPLLLALSFMHCKNVEQREVRPTFIEARPWKKKHGRPLVRYHILDIDPMRKVLRDEGGVEAHGFKKALHICRGHFATYTDNAPLFGRLTGTFWKPQHVRGTARNGMVVKDYNVKAPR